MPLVVIQTTIPDKEGKAFRITEVLDRVADSAAEALEMAAIHIGGDREVTEELLSARWHGQGEYWVVAYEPAPEIAANRVLFV